jgi:signal transduction histidine kinase/DNA-binding response OmpR family regulator
VSENPSPSPERRRPAVEHPRVLVLDDEPAIRSLLGGKLAAHGCEVRCAGSAEDASRLVRDWEPHAALVDVLLPGRNGLQFISDLRGMHPDTAVLVMTSDASVQGALEAVRGGAGDYLEKPFLLDRLWDAVQRALDKRRLELSSRDLFEHEHELRRGLETALPVAPRAPRLDCSGALREVLDDFLRVITRDLEVERASLMLLDEHARELAIVASHGIDEIEAERVRVPLGSGISGFVFETGEPFLVTDTRRDDRLAAPNYPHLGESFLSAPIALSVPIRSERQVIGVVNVTNRNHGKPLGPGDVAYLSALSGQLAGAIEGARRADQLERTFRSLASTREQLACSERMRTVGQMAAGVAHDFNNALSVILGRVELAVAQLQQPSPDLPRVRGDLQSVIRTVMHAAETVQRLQDYTRIRREPAPEPVDLNAVIRETVEADERRAVAGEGRRRPVEVVLDLAEVPQICGNAFELGQVVQHLMSNAFDAMPEGGRLGIRTAEQDGAVLLEVRDTGSGMDEATRSKLFQPFFTTKAGRQGLGMSVVYGVVTRHGGEIDVESRPGSGTTCRLRFPPLDTAEVPAHVDPARRGDGAAAVRVLFVDDDDMVRETYAEALRLGGHDVVGTTSAERALELARERDFDVVITDLSMDAMDGLELATRLKRARPELPVILFSGFALDEDSRAHAGIDRVLIKPCMIDELLTAVAGSAQLRRQATPDRS